MSWILTFCMVAVSAEYNYWQEHEVDSITIKVRAPTEMYYRWSLELHGPFDRASMYVYTDSPMRPFCLDRKKRVMYLWFRRKENGEGDEYRMSGFSEHWPGDQGDNLKDGFYRIHYKTLEVINHTE